MDAMSDGLAKAPQWVETLRDALMDVGFVLGRERRFDQPFGLYAVLLVRDDIGVEIASDRANGCGVSWRIDLMKAEDAARIPRRTTSPATVRAWLEGGQPGSVGEDTAETASWVVGHLGEIASALAAR
jgi:hypothetical protein